MGKEKINICNFKKNIFLDILNFIEIVLKKKNFYWYYFVVYIEKRGKYSVRCF